MKYFFLSIFVIATIIHLYARLKRIAKVRDISKIFILLPLTFFYMFSVEQFNWFVVIALIASWIGDVLLIFHGLKWFCFGGISFLISHVFFIIAYNTYIDYQNVPIWVLISLPILAILIVAVIFKSLIQYLKKPLIVPMFGYLLTNGAMNVFAMFRLISSATDFSAILGPLLTVIGAILFFVSDTTLFFVRFNKNSIMRTHFLVMLTYSIGEFLIVLGLIL